MNAIRKFFRAMQYATEDRKWAIYHDEMMLPPMRKHYDIRGINEMNAYDSYLESLTQKRMELRKQGRLEPIRREVPLHMQKQDLADYRPESLEDRALEMFKP